MLLLQDECLPIHKLCKFESWGMALSVAWAPASKSEHILEVVDAKATFPASHLERERVMLLAENS